MNCRGGPIRRRVRSHHLVEVAFGAEGQQLGGRSELVQHALGPFAVRVVNQVVRLGLGSGNTPFGRGVIRHLVPVAVQMVGRDVEQHSHVRAEGVRPVELEAAHFDHRGLRFAFVAGHALGQASGPARPNVSDAVDVPSFVAKHVVDHGRGRRFAVRPGHGHHGSGVAERPVRARRVLNLADDFPPALAAFLDHGGMFGDARALHHGSDFRPLVETMPTDLVFDAFC